MTLLGASSAFSPICSPSTAPPVAPVASPLLGCWAAASAISLASSMQEMPVITRFWSITSRSISGVVCSHGALPSGPIIPMLLTAMSNPPSLSAASWIMAIRRLSSRASPTTAKAMSLEGWLSAAIRATVSSALSALTSNTATVAPARASQTAISLPIPAPAPVTKALRPLRSIAIAMLLLCFFWSHSLQVSSCSNLRMNQSGTIWGSYCPRMWGFGGGIFGGVSPSSQRCHE